MPDTTTISLLMGDIGKKAGADHAVGCLVSICLVVFSYVLWSCKETGLEEAFEGRGDDVFPEEDLGMLQGRRLRPRSVRRQQQSPGLEACSRRWEATSPPLEGTERPPGNRRGWGEFAAIYKVTETKPRNTDQFVRAYGMEELCITLYTFLSTVFTLMFLY